MHFDQKTTRLNCPNCGAPIDIHRRSCEYCGTPYDNSEEVSLYADNKKAETVYIYQDPIEWHKEDIRRLQAELSQLIQCNAISMAEARARLDALAWEEEKIRQSMNSVPLTSYGPLTEPKVEIINNKAENIGETVGWILVVLAFFSPMIICTILSWFNII